MKQKFSTQWQSSVQPRKQRKYRYNAKLHLRHSFLNAHLSKELKKRYDKRSVPLRKGDEVLVMRGGFAKKKGKVVSIDYKKSRIVVENITRTKKDGTKINAPLSPSNLQILSLDLKDSKRLKKYRKEDEKKKDNLDSQKNKGVKDAPSKNTDK